MTVIRTLRTLCLLALADRCRFWLRCAQSWSHNRKFRNAHPDFPTPPPRLAFDALNHVDWREYREGGRRHARLFARQIAAHCSGNLCILEWGCGPGRLIRHMKAELAGMNVTLSGADYNAESVAWCRTNLPGIQFVHNPLMPPLPLSENTFDVVYAFSVFTHLSEAAQLAWARELCRVLKPGGLLICTTHGDNYRYLLGGPREDARYRHGHVVVQGNYAEGKKWFFAIHPPAFVRDNLLKDFAKVQQVAPRSEDGMLQDIWMAWKQPVGPALDVRAAQPHAGASAGTVGKI